MAQVEKHVPVLLNETLDALAVKPAGRYVDGTFGRGGHSRAIAGRGGEILGIDRDDDALAAAGDFRVVKGCHGDLERIAKEEGWNEVDGILLDLGVSSPQLDEAGRGFSFMRDGPLDMRMDRTAALTAAELVNGESAEGLEAVFRELGEEPQARRIAKAVVAARGRGRIATTAELAALVERTVGRRGGHHPATRVFQALRMAVNDEMGELVRALEGGMRLLKSGGRFAVITFESLTDRTVKRFFADHVGKMRSLQQGGEEWEGKLPRARAVTRKALVASREEIDLNPRSRSAKLRVIEKE
jgi:16S rRNA (cytosine1402-N4)-methyltransferase